MASVKQKAAQAKAAKKMKEAAAAYNKSGNKKTMQQCVKDAWKKKA